jgi:hypothetical protein
MKIINNYIRIIFFLLFTANYFAQEDLKSLLLKRMDDKLTGKISFRYPEQNKNSSKNDKEIRIEGFIGFPYNLPLPLTISQSGEPDIKLTANFDSKPFEIPIYWVWRISYWNGEASWELEAIHHKLFLKNNPGEVREFSISHGLNLITINRGWQFQDFILRGGVGIVVAHPESIVRDKKFSESSGIFNWGYYVSGPTLNLAVAKDFIIVNSFFAICEIKTNFSFASVPIYNGNADLYNIAFQLNFGLGYSLFKFQ